MFHPINPTGGRAARGGRFLLALAILLPGSALGQETSAPCSSGQVPICPGERALCSISPSTDTDIYQFYGTAGESFRITVAGTSNDLDPLIEVFGPDGMPLSQGQKSCSAPWNGICSLSHTVTLEKQGLQTLLVYDNGLNNAGNYHLDLQRVVPQKPLPTISYGQTIKVTLDHLSDHDWLEFEAEAGTHLRISIAGLNNDLDPTVEVLDETGANLSTVTCAAPWNGTCSNQLAFSPFPETGTYYLLVSDSGNNNAGSVNVTLTCVIGNCPPPAPPGPLGSNYCVQTPNSTGGAAAISALGSSLVSDNDVHLQATGVPTGKLGLFFLGAAQAQKPLANSWGLLCVTPPLKRRPVTVACNGSPSVMRHQLDLSRLPQITPGSTWCFQAWFRDPAGTPPKTTNTTDGLQITFQ